MYKKIDKKVVFYIFFLPMIKLAKLCTFSFYTLQSIIYTDEFITCLAAQPPCLWADIILNKIIISKK